MEPRVREIHTDHRAGRDIKKLPPTENITLGCDLKFYRLSLLLIASFCFLCVHKMLSVCFCTYRPAKCSSYHSFSTMMAYIPSGTVNQNFFLNLPFVYVFLSQQQKKWPIKLVMSKAYFLLCWISLFLKDKFRIFVYFFSILILYS